MRRIEARPAGKGVHYTLRGGEVGGGDAVVELADASGKELAALARDLVVLLYGGSGALAAVENLATGAVFWIVPKPGRTPRR